MYPCAIRFCVIAFSMVVLTCSWLISSPNVCGRYLRAITWYMGGKKTLYARPRVIRGTRVKPLPLLPSGPGGVRSRPLHEARSLTNNYPSSLSQVTYNRQSMMRIGMAMLLAAVGGGAQDMPAEAQRLLDLARTNVLHTTRNLPRYTCQ